MFNCVYRDNGRSYPEFDCWGFVKWLYEKEHDTKLEDYDYSSADDSSNSEYFIDEMNNTNWIKTEPRRGVVVALRVNGNVSHVGFMMDANNFVHIMKATGVSIANINNPKWKNRIVGYYVRGIDD